MNHPSGRLVDIYILIDPTTDRVRYVGWSIDTNKRLKPHIKTSENGRERNHKANWIRSLLAVGLYPKLQTVERGVIDFAEREIFWIAYYRSIGEPLTNGTDGGEGMLGYVPTDKARRFLSDKFRGRLGPWKGKKHSLESRAKMSEALRRRIIKPETRRKLSEAMKGRSTSVETRQKASSSQRRKTLTDPLSAAFRLSKSCHVGRWALISRIEGKRNFWICRCECGSIKKVEEQNLAAGGSLSCGCLQREMTSATCKTHGEAHNRSVEYRAWAAMLASCYIPSSSNFPYCGAKNITVCRKWSLSYVNFLKDVGRRPSLGYVLARIDKRKNYTPKNTIWLTEKENSRNKASSKVYVIDGESGTLAHHAERHGLTFHCAWKRLRRGWDIRRAFTTPSMALNGGVSA